MEHVDTVSAARDLELLRRALGQGKLNYLGLSYGSQLGATYAELYPGRIRTLALDGALDHAVSGSTLFTDESRAYEDSLNRFFGWCARTTSSASTGRRPPGPSTTSSAWSGSGGRSRPGSAARPSRGPFSPAASAGRHRW